MPSQSINIEIIKCFVTKYSSKTFALLLIEVHEMIDNFSGIDTEASGGWGGRYGFCHRRHAVVNPFFFFLKHRAILHNTRDGSDYVPYLSQATYNFRERNWLWVGWGEGEEESQGSTPVYYEVCLKYNQLINPNNEKRFFFL